MWKLVRHQLVVVAAGRAAHGFARVKPEPHDGRVVLLANTSHNPLVCDGGHKMGVSFGTGINRWPEHIVWVLALLHGVHDDLLQASCLLLISWNSSSRHGAGQGGDRGHRGPAARRGSPVSGAEEQ